jgi:hypothetical protein
MIGASMTAGAGVSGVGGTSVGACCVVVVVVQAVSNKERTKPALSNIEGRKEINRFIDHLFMFQG